MDNVEISADVDNVPSGTAGTDAAADTGASPRKADDLPEANDTPEAPLPKQAATFTTSTTSSGTAGTGEIVDHAGGAITDQITSDTTERVSATAAAAAATVQQLPATPAAVARSMVPDKEDDELAEGPPRHVSLQNYASKDSGAVMLESSPGSKGMSNLLMNSRDKYAISPCEEKQWAVFGLSEDIMVRTVKIISHEKYSSLVKDFQVLASPTYPVNEWLDLGTFTAKFLQGEQTFEVPQPAFARYLKFKFLTHYGNEFYCTVSQIKVHGSTMMESFHDEWQQSSAEVREVQDSLMLTKKDNTKAAATASGLGTNGNGTKTTTSAPSLGAGGGSEGGTAPTATPTRHSTKHQTPTSTAATGDGEAGVEHRPHAASAATVPPLAEKRTGTASPGGGGDIGSAELTVEDIVRGVPAEMVVPATTCSGPIGVDGVCHGKILTDIASGGGDDVAEGAGGLAAAAESKILATELPAMGASSSNRPNSGGAGGREKDAAGSGAGSSGTNTVNGVDGGVRRSGGAEQRVAIEITADDIVGVSEASGAAGREATRDRREGLKSEVGITGEETGNVHGNKQVAEGGDGAVDSNAGGNGGDPVETSVRPAVQAVDEEIESPPRKGIITSTMEAISKAVGGSDAGKKRRSDDGKTVEDAAAAGAHPSSGSSEATATTTDVSSSDSDATGDGVVQDERGAVEVDDARGGGKAIGVSPEIGSQPDVELGSQKSAEAGGGTSPDDSRTYPAMGTDDGVPQPQAKETASAAAAAGGGGGGGDGNGPNEMQHAAQDPAADSGSGGSGNIISTSNRGRPPVQSDAPNGTRDRINGNHDRSEATGGAGGSDEARQGPVAGELGETGETLTAEVGGNPSDVVGALADVAPVTDAQAAAAAADAGMDVDVGVIENDGVGSVADEVKGRAGSDSNAATAVAGSFGDAPSPASSERVDNQQDLSLPSATVAVQREGRQEPLPSDADRHRWAGEGNKDDASAPAEQSFPENLVQYTDAARAAACLDRLSFSEFRDQVLARTQQAQQSSGGGVAIGGQYESIFKTLMNKIKTLEINQSLFSLYVDEVHGCYQDVIGLILAEQEQAHAVCSELLSAHSASLMKIGDQWPAFQELQTKVAEVEKRMLLGSMAWFTSLLCLLVMVSTCCIRSCGLFGGGRRRGRKARGGASGGEKSREAGEEGWGEGESGTPLSPPEKSLRRRESTFDRSASPLSSNGFDCDHVGAIGKGDGNGFHGTVAPSGSGPAFPIACSSDMREDCSRRDSGYSLLKFLKRSSSTGKDFDAERRWDGKLKDSTGRDGILSRSD